MVIGIDASRIENNDKTGVENYTREVIARLINLDKKNNYILYSRCTLNFGLTDNAINKVLKFPMFWTQIRLAIEMLFKAPDLLFIPSHTVPLIHPKNTVAVIHGLEYEYFPKCYSWRERLKNKIGTYLSAKRAKIIITPSQNTKHDLIRLYKIVAKKIRVVYPGISTVVNWPTRQDGNVPDPYCLFIGRIEHRKNIIRIIKAFEKIKKEKKIPLRLILAGKDGYGSKQIKDCIANSEFKTEISLTGYISDQEKNVLLKNTSVFIFPTLYEGFGFPILEAMNLGAPVITSNIGSASEVAGEGAILVNPRSIDEIAYSVYKVLSDSDLRENLIKKGYENAKRFNWDECAKKILEILNNKV